MSKKKKKVIIKALLSQVDMFADTELAVKDSKDGTEEQNAFIKYKGKESIILSATAGSGKSFSGVQRLKELLQRGVDPSKIIFFSFTKAATEELQKRIGADVKITTIHAFCLSILSKIGKFKKIATFYDFIGWFKEKYKPRLEDSSEAKDFYYQTISSMYEEAEYLASSIAAFKLQSADGIKCRVPNYINEYNSFMREKRARDFSDMLIETRDILKEEKWLKMFRGSYEYIIVDEHQDVSCIQMQVLLSLNAEHYYLMGDRAQSIFGYSQANCLMVENMLKGRRNTIEQTLSINFRSDKKIVENSNKYTHLQAIANSEKEGFLDNKIMLKIDELVEILQTPEEVAVLCRTNDVIKKIELFMLKRKIPMRYFNFITETDIKHFAKGEISQNLKNKFSQLKDYFEDENEIIHFIHRNKNSNKLVTSQHKSKGCEWDVTVVVNSIAPDMLIENNLYDKLSKKQLQRISFDLDEETDLEPKCIHYVVVSRARHKIYFMIMLF